MEFGALGDQQLVDFVRSAEGREYVPGLGEQEAAIDRALSALSSPAAAVREQVGYELLWRWTTRKSLEPEVAQTLGERVSEWFGPGHSIQQRCFAPLVLACLAHVGVHRQEWAGAFANWWVREPNTIGLDAQLGWLHAVAHGADYVDELALNDLMPAATLLPWCTARMTFACDDGGTDPDVSGAWCAQEDTRLAVALRSVTAMQPAPDLRGWVQELEAIAGFRQPAPIPAAHSNTVRTLRAFAADLAVSAEQTPEQRAILDQLRPLVTLPS